MPEGDIICRVAERLDSVLTGLPLTYCLFRWPSLAQKDLTGMIVSNVRPYGKHLLIDFSSGLTFRSHLRMDGAWLIERAFDGRPGQSSRGQRWTARAVLANQSWVVIGNKLGMADLVATRRCNELIGHLGPDVMAEDFQSAKAAQRFEGQVGRMIGEALLDQTLVTGIGTIYMAESLFAWRTRPDRPSDQVNDLAGLLECARRLLKRSVAAGTPTATGLTETGRTSYVHGREHQPCVRCSTPIACMRVGAPPFDRPAFYCPTCQPG
jgi:endonuclease-8